jgi:hypothetical protein
VNPIAGAISAIRYAPHWLALRETLRGERKLIVWLQGRREHGRMVGDSELIDLCAERNRRQAEDLEASGARRLIFSLYDFGTGVWPPFRPGLRLVGKAIRRAVMAVNRGEPNDADLRAPAPPLARAAAVPFGNGFPRRDGGARIGVIIHAYYPELVGEIREYLENLPAAADLYLSTDSEAKRTVILEIMSEWPRGTVEVRVAPNRGRDIAPKLIAFRDVYDRHPLVLHLHGKKSEHESRLGLWRYFLYENLIGDPAVVSSILSAFAADPTLGMVAPDHFCAVKAGVDWGGNLQSAQNLARRMDFVLGPRSPVDFPSGSMFWARSAALRPLLDLDLAASDFPEEQGQIDGTLAHAIERLFFYACEKAGLRWLKVCRPELAEDREPPQRIGGAEELRAHLAAVRPLEPRPG